MIVEVGQGDIVEVVVRIGRGGGGVKNADTVL
jgi:hypothetical protein